MLIILLFRNWRISKNRGRIYRHGWCFGQGGREGENEGKRPVQDHKLFVYALQAVSLVIYASLSISMWIWFITSLCQKSYLESSELKVVIRMFSKYFRLLAQEIFWSQLQSKEKHNSNSLEHWLLKRKHSLNGKNDCTTCWLSLTNCASVSSGPNAPCARIYFGHANLTTKPHFEIPNGYSYGTRIPTCISYSYGILTKLIRAKHWLETVK